ncbi:hypothetical protein EVAR_61562_1 [Eumeta japonica]|uniref:Uncharacterized protein n=1 Tax=Eumeta variegata TaxID=151549 RepID=A0A4C1YQ23_EUMVA|nr:hypothetical protein EVAR_61562_1 [Eumeta japonica]
MYEKLSEENLERNSHRRKQISELQTSITGTRPDHRNKAGSPELRLRLKLKYEAMKKFRMVTRTNHSDDIVNGINNIVQRMISGEDKIYMSTDTMTNEQESINIPTELLN